MSLPLVFRTGAQREFNEAALWYEEQRAGLGSDFAETRPDGLDKIIEQPDHYAVVSGDVREAPVSRFPYAIYYRAKPDRVVILAVFHCSRDPAIWMRRT